MVRFILLVFIFSFLGCQESGKTEIQIIKELSSVNLYNLINRKASVSSRRNNDLRIIYSNFLDLSEGLVLQINNDCEVSIFKKLKWSDSSKIDPKSFETIEKCFCDIGLNAIAVDSCGNAYFSITRMDNYEFVLVKEKNSLDKIFTYEPYIGNCYSIK